MKSILKNKKGFTLIELIIVIVILGVLATLVGPRMIGSIKQSKINTVVGNVQTVEKAAAQWFAEKGTEPTAADLKSMMNKELADMGMSLDETATVVNAPGSANETATLTLVLTIHGPDSAVASENSITVTPVDVSFSELQVYDNKVPGDFTTLEAGKSTKYEVTIN